MTVRQLYEALLIELNKVEAPALLLKDFLYFLNKKINGFEDALYLAYDTNQAIKDALRQLEHTAHPIIPTKTNKYGESLGSIYECYLPDDYRHILNVMCEFTVTQDKSKCKKEGDIVVYNANKMTSDNSGTIINDYFQRPKVNRPYYFIHNVSNPVSNPYDEYNPITNAGTDIAVHIQYDINNNIVGYETDGYNRTIQYGGNDISIVDKVGGVRYGGISKTRMEIRYGKDGDKYELTKIYVDYLKAPQYCNMEQEQLDLVEDTTQIIEFPDYICYQIIDGIKISVLENTSDARFITSAQLSSSSASK